MKWAGLALALAGGITFVLAMPQTNLVGLGIGVVLFVVGIFAMKT